MKNKKRIFITSGLVTLGALLFIGGFSGISSAIKENFNRHKGDQEIVDGSYVDGKIMVKLRVSDTDQLKAAKKLAKGRESLIRNPIISNIERTVYEQQDDDGEFIWYECSLDNGANIKDAVRKMDNVPYVACAEPLYVRNIDSTIEGADTESVEDQCLIDFGKGLYPMASDDINLAKAQQFLADNGINKGGSNDVIVAVLDTGVDYTHPALRNNMWINTAEIPGNGMDDDNNGYVDDVYGASVLGSTYDHTGDPMDVNGHGTHVAGIIASRKVNNKGIVGVANNVRIMAIRAGQPSGVFTTADIVDGITYAYRMGADVLNMSFGGYTRSQLEIDALQRAYNTTVLCAAAGNDTMTNLPYIYGKDMYPGALPWVVGVMSSDTASSPTTPSYLSYFSNVDYYAADNHEYEVCAPGYQITSTLPNNRYATWSGTSMATPVVSGVAALLRSYFTDKVEYTSRFIMGQLSSTGNDVVYPTMAHVTLNSVFNRIDAYKALTERPQPKLELYDFFIDDSPEINARNDGDGALDSGETVYLGVSIKNLWGKATNVSVKLDCLSGGNVADPYIQYERDTVNYLDVGAWEEMDNGWIRDADSAILGIEADQAFIIHVDEHTPNDIVHVFNVTITCTNGMDQDDQTTYIFAPRQGQGITYTPENAFSITSRNGRELPSVISEDMTLTKDYYWILPTTTRIEDGVTVTVEAGTQIQFYGSEDASVYAQPEVVTLVVRGKFITLGTPEEPVELFPSALLPAFTVNIEGQEGAFLNYTNIENPCVRANQIKSCYFYQDEEVTYNYQLNPDTANVYRYYQNVYVYGHSVKDSIFYNLGMVEYPYYQFVVADWYCRGADYDCCLFNQCYMTVSYDDMEQMTNCVFLNNTITNENGSVFASSIKNISYNEDSKVVKVFERESDGTVYILYTAPSYNAAERFAEYLGGYVVSINDQEENDFLRANCSDNYYIGYKYDGTNDRAYWEDGTFVTFDLLDASVDKKQITGNRHVFGGSNYSTWTLNETYYYNEQRFLLEIPQNGIVKDITFSDEYIEIDEETSNYSPIINVFPMTADKDDLVYSSTDENVFVVSENGEISATGKGIAELVVSSSDQYVSKSITVRVVDKVAVEDIRADVSRLFIEVNDTYQLTISYTPTNTTEKTVRFESSDESVIEIDQSGLVRAKSDGTAFIRIYDVHGVMKHMISVQAEILVDELKNDEDIYYSYVGQSFDLNVTHSPSTVTLFKYEYESSNPDVATVDSNGHIEVLKEGYALIRVKDKYSGAYYDINVSSTGTFIEEPKMVDIVFTDNFYYALSDDGNVYYWGNDVTKTTKLASLRNITNIYGYYYSGYALALASDGALYVLASNGNEVAVYRVNSPEAVVRAFIARDKYYFEVESGGIYAFGENHYKSLGIGRDDGGFTSYTSPVLVFSYGNVKTVVGTYKTTFILTNDSEVYYCGRNEVSEFTDLTSSPISWKNAYTANDWTSVVVQSVGGAYYSFNEDNFSAGILSSLDYYFNYYHVDGSSIKDIYFADPSYFAFVNQEGQVRFNGTNDNSKFGAYLSNSWINCYDNYLPYDGFNAKKVIFNGYNSAIITNEGRIYMMGYSAQGRMGFNGTGTVKTPKQIYFDVQVPGSLEISSCNLSRTEMNANVDPNQQIDIRFNQGIVKGGGYNNIKLVDRNGNRVEFNKELTINGVIISPIGSWDNNTSYTLTIPSSAFANNFGDASSQCIIRFTSGSVLVDSLTFNDSITIDSETANYVPDFTVSPLNADLTTLNWSSTDENVFVVDDNGRITATGVGNAQLVVTSSDGYLRRVNTVTVYEHIGIEDFLIGKDNYELIYGNSALIETTIIPSTATEPLSFVSNDNSVVTVSPSGLIETVGTGNTTITVSNNKGTIVKTITVRVDRDVESVSCDSVIYGIVGQTQQLNIEIEPANATRVNLTYESDNDAYVTVDENGLVSFLQAGLSTVRIIETNSKTTLDVMVSVSESLQDEIKVEKVVACGSRYYALDENGNVWAWGYEKALPEMLASNVKDIAGIGEWTDTVLLLNKDNTVSYIDGYSLRSTMLTDITRIFAFNGKMYALGSDDMLYARGNNDYNSLGVSADGYIDQFEEVGVFENIKSIAGGYYNAFILLEDGTIYAAGGHNIRYEGFTKLKLSVEVEDIYSEFYPYDGAILMSKTGKLYGFDSGNCTLYSISEGYYNTANAKQIAFCNANASTTLFDDGTVQFIGGNDNYRFGEDVGTWYYSYNNLKPDIDNVKFVAMSSYNTFFITESGELFMMGSGQNNRLGVNNVRYATTPIKMNFSLENEKSLDVVSTSLDAANNNIGKDQSITITFNQKIQSSGYWNNIRVESRTGTIASTKRSIGLNTITITPTRGWEQGATYNVIIPGNAVRTALGQQNNSLNYSFTTGNSIINSIYFDSGTLAIDTNTADFYSGLHIEPQDGLASDLIWESSDESVFTVDGSGNIHVVGIGSATLNVRTGDNYCSTSRTINVSEYIALDQLVVGKTNYEISIYDNFQIEYSKLPSNATPLISFESSDENVVRVNTNGYVSAVGTGNATITVRCADEVKLITLKVDAYAESISVNKYVNAKVGDVVDLDAQVLPENTTIKELTYTVDNTSLATVDENGHVTILGQGLITVRVTENVKGLVQDVLISAVDNSQDIEVEKIIYFDDYMRLVLDTQGNIWGWSSYCSTPKLVISNVRDAKYYYSDNFNYRYELIVLDTNGVLSTYILNNGDSTLTPTIYRQNELSDIKALYSTAGSSNELMAVKNNGDIYVKGCNYNACLGTGSNSFVYDFTKVSSIQNIKSVAMTNTCSAILTEGGDLYVAGSENVLNEFVLMSYSVDIVDLFANQNAIYAISNLNNIYRVSSRDFSLSLLSDSYYSNTNKVIAMSSYEEESYVFVLEDGSVRITGYNNYNRLGGSYTTGARYYVSDNHNADGLEDIKQVCMSQYGVLFLNNSGELFFLGRPRDNLFGPFFNETFVFSPRKVEMNYPEFAPIQIISSTFDNGFDNIPNDQELRFEFNQKVDASSYYNAINIRSRSGKSVSISKALRFNVLTISNNDLWEENEVYTLTIRADSFRNSINLTNEEITYTFTTGPKPVMEMGFSSLTLNIDTITTDFDSGFFYGPVGADLSTIVFESSDENVFTVNELGQVTGLSAGSGTLTVRTLDNALSASININVSQYIALENFTIGKENYQMQYGNTALIEITKTPSDATPPISFVSNNEEVATVSTDGLITAVGTGTAVITVNCGEFTYTINVKSDAYVDSIDCETIIIGNAGEEKAIDVVLEPIYATISELTFESDKPQVASVDENGRLSLNAVGTATIRAKETYSGLYVDITVIVQDPGIEEANIVKVIGYSYNTNFALNDNGDVYAWGKYIPVPRIILTDIADIWKYNTDQFVILRNNGTVERWYYSDDRDNIYVGRVFSLQNVESIYVYNHAIFAVDEDGVLYSCGYNRGGRLGSNGEADQWFDSEFRLVGEFGDIKNIAVSSYATIILTEDGSLLIAGTVNNQYLTFVDFNVNFDVENIYMMNFSCNYILLESTSKKIYSFNDNTGLVHAVDEVYYPSNYSKFMPLGTITYAFILEDGSVQFTGENGFGYINVMRDWVYDSDKAIINGSNPFIQVDSCDNTIYLIDSEHNLYALGYRRYLNQFGLGANNDKYTEPQRILFEVEGNEDISVVSSTFDNGTTNIDLNQKLVFKFNQKIDSPLLSAIRVRDRLGNNVSVKRAVSFNTLTITPNNGWNADAVYNIEMPAGAFKNVFGKDSAAFSYTFTTGNTPVDSMHFNLNEITIGDNISSFNSGLVVEPANADRNTIIYESSDESVFTVDSNGLISATGVGDAILTARTIDGYLEVTQQIHITEYVALENFVINKDNYQMQYGNTAVIESIKTPNNATQNISYVSSDETVATVSADGTITAVGTGNAIITVSCGEYSYDINVRSDAYVEELNIGSSLIEGVVGSTEEIEVNTKPVFATISELTFTSDNEEIVTVSDEGLVTFIGAGIATIRVKENCSGLYKDVVVNSKANDSDGVKIVKAINASTESSFALDDDGNLYMWTSYVTNPMVLRTGVKDFVKQGWSDYGILYEDGRVEVWYQDSARNFWSRGFFDVEDIQQLYGCCDSLFAIDSEGYVYARGSNSYGKLGTNVSVGDSISKFTLVAQFDNIKKITGTSYFSVIILENGEVYMAGTRQTSRTSFAKVDLPFDVLDAYPLDNDGAYLYFESTTHKIYRCYAYDMTYNAIHSAYVPENYIGLCPLSSDGYAFILEGGRIQFTSHNSLYLYNYDQYLQVSDGMIIDFGSEINYVKAYSRSLYVVTADGNLYGLGRNEYLNEFGSLFDGTSTNEPVKIPLGLEYNSSIEVKSSTLDLGITNISSDSKLEFVFNQKVDVGVINLIKVTTRTGTNVAIKRSFDFNKLTISATNGWEDNTVYELTIPQGVFKNAVGDSNDAISYVFTTGNQYVENMYFTSSSLVINDNVSDYGTGLVVFPVDADKSTIVYESSREDIFTVDAQGRITAVGQGTATLTARTSDGYLVKTQEIIVKEYIPLTGISLDRTTYDIEVGNSVLISKTIMPSDATESITFVSSNNNVVTVTNDGFMNAVGVGTATVTMRSASGSIEQVINVSVNQFVHEITSDDDLIIVEYQDDGFYQLQYQLLPETYSDVNLVFTCTNPTIASVNRTGKVFYLDTGLVTIRVQDTISGSYHDFTLSIVDAVEDVEVVQVAACDSSECPTYLLDSEGYVWGLFKNFVSPEKIPGISNIKEIKAGGGRVLALSEEGKVYVIDNRSVRCINELSGVKVIFASCYNYFIYLDDNSLWGFGSNSSYGLGIGNDSDIGDAIYIGVYDNIKDIVSSYNGSLLLLENGSLYVTGYNRSTVFTRLDNYSNVTHLVEAWGASYFVSNNVTYGINNAEIFNSNSSGDYYYAGNVTKYNYVSSNCDNNAVIYQLNDNEFASIGFTGNYGRIGFYAASDWKGFSKFATFDEKVVSFDISYRNSYFVTESGKLYALGHYDFLGYGVTENLYEPHLIRFNLSSVALQTTGNNCGNAIALNAPIEVLFNQKIVSKNLQNVTVRDANGNRIAIIVTVELNKLVITPYRPWAANSTYYVDINGGAVATVTNETNMMQQYTFTTVAEGSQPGEGNQGQWYVGSGNNNTRVVAEKAYVDDLYEEFVSKGLNSKFTYNAFLNDFSITDIGQWMKIVAGSSSDYQYKLISLGSNYWGTTNSVMVDKQIMDYDDYSQYYDIDPYPILTDGVSSMYPFVSKMEIIDASGEPIEYAIQGEENHIRLHFNRDMDTTIDLGVFYGPDMPYTDWKIDGHYVDTRTWEGDFTLSTLAGNGLMHLFIVDGAAADNNWLKLHKDQHFTFSIRKSDTAESLNLVATGAEGRIILNWEQDDFETLAGYNVYRCDTLDGFRDDQSWKDSHRINNSVLTEKTFEDTNVEPGKYYFYRFTVVQTDLVESEYSNTAPAAAMDTTPPVINHEVISSGTTNCDLYINATVTDNVEVTKVTLYYSINDGEYKSIEMIDTGENNNVYSAMIPGREMVSGSIKYYIVAFDGISNAYHGDANQPHYARIGSKPVINSVSPNSGDIKGGEEVIVSGMNFREGDRIKFGSTFAQNIQVIDSNTIKCNAPMVSIPQTVNVMVVSDDGGYYTLINGYTYTASTVYAEIPDVRGTYGSYIEVPINLSNAKGLVSADIVIGYRTADLEYVEANKGTLGRSFNLVDDGGYGEVAISTAGATSITGNGSIVNLKFKVKIQEGAKTQLSFKSISLNGGSIDVETTVGQVIGVKAYSVTGNISYYASGLGVENVNVYLSGKDSISTTSNGSGEYAFNNLDVGSYDLSFSKNDDVNGITALDASYILQYKVNIRSLTPNQLIAADANNNGVVDSFDASLILQYSVGLIELPFSGRNETWVFKNNNQSLGELSANYEAGNNQAILIGDVTGDWSNQSQGNALNNNPFGAIQVGKVNIINNQVIVPVMVKNGGADVYSVQFALRYSNDLTYVGYQLDNDAMVAVNSNVPGAIRVATASATDILDDELVYYFTFNIKNAADSYFFSVNDSNINEHYNIVNYANAVVTSDTITVTAEEILAHYNETYLDGDISRYDLDGNGVVDMFDVITLQNRAQ